MTDKQPDTLRLADELEEPLHDFPEPTTLEAEAASELRRLHAENETLRAGYAAARLEIESLNAQLHAAKQINAAQFGLLAASIPGSALRTSHAQAPTPAAVAWPVAVLKFERGTPGRENEMPRVVSCNWMPDGEYEVYLAAAPATQPAPQQDAQEPVAVVVPCYTPSGKRVALYSAKQDLPIGTQLYLAPQPVECEPLTREQVKAICVESGYETATLQERADFINGIRHAERHHGIKKGGQHGAE